MFRVGHHVAGLDPLCVGDAHHGGEERVLAEGFEGPAALRHLGQVQLAILRSGSWAGRRLPGCTPREWWPVPRGEPRDERADDQGSRRHPYRWCHGYRLPCSRIAQVRAHGRRSEPAGPMTNPAVASKTLTSVHAKAFPWPAAFFLLAAIWGCSFWWIKLGLRSFSPVDVAFGRLAVGGTALVAISGLTPARFPRQRTTWGHLFVLAILFNSVPFTLVAYGETHISAVLAGIINALTPSRPCSWCSRSFAKSARALDASAAWLWASLASSSLSACGTGSAQGNCSASVHVWAPLPATASDSPMPATI